MTLQLDWLRGCATALVTPFKSDGAVDEQRLRDLIEYQISGGVRVLVPCGTTGESVTMTEEENQFVIRTTVELSRGRAKVIAGTGSNSTAVTIARSQTAIDLRVVVRFAPFGSVPSFPRRRESRNCSGSQHSRDSRLRGNDENAPLPTCVFS